MGQTSGQSLITQAVDESKLARLAGNTHPLALPQYDHGPAPLDLPMQRMLLVLKRSPQQEATLESLLEDQQYKLAANFHKWLTPAEFGQQFGTSDQDIRAITSWLTAHGFLIAQASKGRNVIEFSGTAAQVQEAFHTTIHSYDVNGEQHWANSSDPQIPAALAAAVAGVDTLNNFRKKAMHIMTQVSQSAGAGTPAAPRPLLTAQCGTQANGSPIYCNGVGPYDFATIYNVLPLWTATSPIDGTGQSIALIGRSNINPQDVSDFRNLFGLSPNPPQIILDGPDPGLVPGDETEADLDVELSGAVAKGATIKLIVSESTETTDGVDLSAEYAVDNDVAPIISESFGNCEFFIGAAGNQFYKNLWQQAAAEGISVFVSSGDQGSAGCDFFQGVTPQPARNGLQVSGIASTPYNVAVGGTDFNDFSNPLTYWNLINKPTTQESAKGYIPETTWNDACTNAVWAQVGFTTNAESNCNNPRLSGDVVTIGGSGGKSGCISPTGSTVTSCSGAYAKPAWQSGPGVPSDSVRDLPDVSLFSSDGFVGNFYMICEADIMPQPCNPSNPLNIVGIGGTSASSPAFAGLMALVDQKTSARQGNPNFVLYKLAAQQSPSNCNSSTGPASTCVFNDVTSGTIAMPCATGSLNCTTSTFGDQYGVLSGYDAVTGYDLATGLGSVNAANLVNDWNTVTFTPSVTTLTLNNGIAINVTHGSPINVSVSVSPKLPVPTGDVSLIATQGSNTYGFDTMTLSGGTASGTTSMLPGGASYTVKAHYEGDGTYGGSDSSPVTVTVKPEVSKTNLHVVTIDPSTGQITNTNATTFPYGSFYLLRADVTNSSAANCFSSSSSALTYACPTGSVSLTDNGGALGSSSFGLNSQGYTEDQMLFQGPAAQLTGGSHTLAASYSGDNSYTASSATDSIAVTPAPTTTTFQFPQGTGSQVIIGSPTSFLSAQTTSLSSGVTPTGTFAFLDGTSQVSVTSAGGCFTPTPDTVCSQGSVSATISAPSGPHMLTAKYSGDTNYASSTSSPVTVNAVYPTTVNVVASPSSVIFGQGTSVTVTATVDTTNPVSNAALKPTGTIALPSALGNVTTTATQDSSGNWELQATATFTPQQSISITAIYSGDSNYEFMTGNGSVNVTIPDFTVSAGTTPLTITAGQSGSTTITITPATSFTSTVSLSCAGPNIPGANCVFSPASVTLSNNQPATATLTISTLAPSSSTSAVTIPAWIHASMMMPPPVRSIWWTLSLLAGLAALLLVASPSRRQSLHAVLGLALVCLLSFALGCGGASGSGPPASTTTSLSVPSTKVANTSSLTLTATVNSPKAVTGTVTFATGNCFANYPVPVTGSTAQLLLNPIPFTPGTCTFVAQYSGDANNQRSQSGSLNIAITGSVALQIAGQTSTLSHGTSVNVTIQ
ncbi:MAG TPA: Ig-like domain repeat protein [Candidatus Acidoferrales bacterium]|nr:Ig-like domain repeat protein [Candidatus Acidoferrales bacterium]